MNPMITMDAAYGSSFPLSVEHVSNLLAYHRISVHIGFVVVQRTIHDPRWYAYLTDQMAGPDEPFPIGSDARTTGRGSTPDTALLDLVRQVSGATLYFRLDFGRVRTSIVMPVFETAVEEEPA